MGWRDVAPNVYPKVAQLQATRGPACTSPLCPPHPPSPTPSYHPPSWYSRTFCVAYCTPSNAPSLLRPLSDQNQNARRFPCMCIIGQQQEGICFDVVTCALRPCLRMMHAHDHRAHRQRAHENVDTCAGTRMCSLALSSALAQRSWRASRCEGQRVVRASGRYAGCLWRILPGCRQGRVRHMTGGSGIMPWALAASACLKYRA